MKVESGHRSFTPIVITLETVTEYAVVRNALYDIKSDQGKELYRLLGAVKGQS